MMWKTSKQSISSGSGSINAIAGRDVYLNIEGNVPTEFVDEKIEEQLIKLKQSRFYNEFDSISSSLNFGERLCDGSLSGGSNIVRRRALSWCARLLSRSEHLDDVTRLLKLANSLGDCQESVIAQAFIFSQQGDKAAALKILAGINTDISNSAGLMIVGHHDAAAGGLQWMNDSGYQVNDLDSDGKSIYLDYLFKLGRWDDALQTIADVTQEDFESTPILYHMVALAHLIPVVPSDYRPVVLAQVPFEVAECRLASTTDAMQERNRAHSKFLKALEVAIQLSCSRAARVADEYALWLELCDPAKRFQGKNRLEKKLRDSKSALGFVRFALQFGIKLDISAVEREIERELAVNACMTVDAAIARFAIAFAQPSAEEAANYIARHLNELAIHIDVKLMKYRQIEMLTRAGLFERAHDVLLHLVDEGIPVNDEKNLRAIITDAQASDPIAVLKARYEESKSLDDLINLVNELSENKRWDDLCEFASLLFEETQSLSDAERLVLAYNSMSLSGELVGFLKKNKNLLSQSKFLQMSYAWGLYNEGDIHQSRLALSALSNDIDNPSYRKLQINLGIISGDWASLSVLIVNEYQCRNDRNAHELISAAKLALHISSSYAKVLLYEAVAKANNDCNILANAYFIATSAGWEDEPDVVKWLEKAAKLSGENGPIKKMSLKDLLDRKPEWDRRESDTWRMLGQSQLPIFLAAESVNRSLVDLMIYPALDNLSITDLRRISLVPAYSGTRVPSMLDFNCKTVALDASALLTLSFLKLLDVVLDAFDTIYLSHSTLHWLFDERQTAAYHQPSRVADAHRVRDLLARGDLKQLDPASVANSDLAAQVGDELAVLITEAESSRYGDELQHIVVRSGPVYRLSSLMGEEVDLSVYAAYLSGCLAVVGKLRQKGQITADQERRARAYLQLHEKPWPHQPDIVDGAILYLDSLSISYFLHLGLLEKFKNSGLNIIISSNMTSELNALISYERISEEALNIIESIRASLHTRIESGHVRLSGKRTFTKFSNNSDFEHPSVGMHSFASVCDYSIIDDRFINKHTNLDSGGKKVPVFTTLDLMDALVNSGFVTREERLEYRTQLRRAGFCFIPVDKEELDQYLSDAIVRDGKLIETAELKAIRESVLRIRMSDWLQLPEEAPWLDGVIKVFIYLLKDLWKSLDDDEKVVCKSNWLVEQIDIRGWAHSLIPELADDVIRVGRAEHILLLLTPPADIDQKTRDAYWGWVETTILVPLQEQFPMAYEWLVDWYSNYIAKYAESKILEEDGL